MFTESIQSTKVATQKPQFDYVLVGGGLQSGVMALAILHHKPDAKIAIIEEGPQLAGNHTWSFHATDLLPGSRDWAQDIIESSWPGYDIRAGGRNRRVDIPYCTCSSHHFAKIVAAKLNDHDGTVMTNTTATDLFSDYVLLSDGRSVTATTVFDNRGPTPLDKASFRGGFQKFYGFELELESDWISSDPIVMDDRVDQTDGFRFIYSLPMEKRRVLVEDTRFSNTPAIDRTECFAQVRSYLADRGFTNYRIIREESGVLPMPINGFTPGYALPKLAGGYRGGWFHAATGYSFAMAIQVAELVATTPHDDLPAALQGLRQRHAGRARFSRFLNRLLFELVKPKTRYQIFRRFYRVLDESAIARFYGHRFTWLDAFRIVVGVPPRGLRPINFARSFVTTKSQRSKSPSPIRKEVTA